ncbi:Mis12-Mtw1 domain protein [Paecilomyces variotii No. 5]|uniref:Mis12-Mtw1 domain protein n=1 Tax=Byssochlamys spectabilis (strain No. 5 / NBRC 109023) TaxID=1356009 RepID=V5HXJ1_BYSSN|nr:Mis12-Mtw1 domain protein [Paecilomyces variotii No. 5]
MSTTVITTSSTKLTRREPLRAIDMATSQAQTRPASSSAQDTGKGKRARGAAKTREDAAAVNTSANGRSGRAMENKRKADYDEDVDGFQFTRPTKPKKAKASVTETIEEEPAQQRSPKRGRPAKSRTEAITNGVTEGTTKVNGTSNGRGRRRSSRIPSAEPDRVSEEPSRPTRKFDDIDSLPAEPRRKRGKPSKSGTTNNAFMSPEPSQPGTSKIALPAADTPVIRRNKEMRTDKAKKGQRRSSLGMRGRRASSLIDSGASNGGKTPLEERGYPGIERNTDTLLAALPHKEVNAADFYKHIASDLPEPRRMRQLLTWCATRAMGDKPSGSRSDDESARLAARVIQEELLEDFANVSELSDWFDRQETEPPAVVVKKPNPKNIQNAEKIKELEEQIQRLQNERHSLNALSRTPSIPPTKSLQPERQTERSRGKSDSQSLETQDIDASLLDPSQRDLIAILNPAPQQTGTNRRRTQKSPADILSNTTISAVSSRLSQVTSSLAPTLDSFAAGVHDIELYRSTADKVSSQVLRICAERLEERDMQNSLERLEIEGDADEAEEKARVRIRREKPTDVSLVLGALSRLEKR